MPRDREKSPFSSRKNIAAEGSSSPHKRPLVLWSEKKKEKIEIVKLIQSISRCQLVEVVPNHNYNIMIQ